LSKAFRPVHRSFAGSYSGISVVRHGGFKESCNCNREDLRDIHINVVAAESEKDDETKYVIVEFSPRWEKKFDLDDSDYNAMLQTVKGQIEGKWVKSEGYMLYDYFHANASESLRPGKAGNWRATPWEVHPVTTYTVVPQP